jgi:hypothetical protein
MALSARNRSVIQRQAPILSHSASRALHLAQVAPPVSGRAEATGIPPWPDQCQRGERAPGWLTGDAWHAVDAAGRPVVVVIVDPETGALERERLFSGLERLRRLARAGDLPTGVLAPLAVDPKCRWFVSVDPGTPLLHAAEGLSATSRSLLLASLVDALEGLHQRGIVNGALSAVSVFLTAEGNLALVEAGCADLALLSVRRPACHPDLELAAPEVLDGEPAGASSDVFALGVLGGLLLGGEIGLATETSELFRRCRLTAPSQRPDASDLALQLLVAETSHGGPSRQLGDEQPPGSLPMWELLSSGDHPTRTEGEQMEAGFNEAPNYLARAAVPTQSGAVSSGGPRAASLTPTSVESPATSPSTELEPSGVYPSARPPAATPIGGLSGCEGCPVAVGPAEGAPLAGVPVPAPITGLKPILVEEVHTEVAPETFRSGGLGPLPARAAPSALDVASRNRAWHWALVGLAIFSLLAAAVQFMVR